jgi:hypothetical protein
MNCFQKKLCKIRPNNEKAEEFIQNIFLWQFDRPICNKLNKLIELPNKLRKITAIATQL